MKSRGAATDAPQPKLRDAEAALRSLYAGCSRDSVFDSRRAASGLSGHDYLDAVLKPYRDAGTIPTFNNHAAMVAWVLTLPEPPPRSFKTASTTR